jgi:hypothetical protein
MTRLTPSTIDDMATWLISAIWLRLSITVTIAG